MEDDLVGAVNALLAETEEAHGRYEATELNGVYDEEWPRWYAAYAVDHGIGELLGRDVTTDKLAEFLADRYAQFEQTNLKPSEGWAAYMARRIAAEL
jgi:hypothetical protein